VTPWSVLPEEYGDFLINVYEEWVRHDVGSVFVMNFEEAFKFWAQRLRNWLDGVHSK